MARAGSRTLCFGAPQIRHDLAECNGVNGSEGAPCVLRPRGEAAKKRERDRPGRGDSDGWGVLGSEVRGSGDASSSGGGGSASASPFFNFSRASRSPLRALRRRSESPWSGSALRPMRPKRTAKVRAPNDTSQNLREAPSVNSNRRAPTIRPLLHVLSQRSFGETRGGSVLSAMSCPPCLGPRGA